MKVEKDESDIKITRRNSKPANYLQIITNESEHDNLKVFVNVNWQKLDTNIFLVEQQACKLSYMKVKKVKVEKAGSDIQITWSNRRPAKYDDLIIDSESPIELSWENKK